MINCIFCKMVGGSVDNRHQVIYEDNKYVGMLVSHPETNGHFIVFTKEHFSELSEVTERGKLFEKTIELAESITPKLSATAYVIKINNNVYRLDDNPLHVGHIHLHVIPKYEVNKKDVPPLPATRSDLNDMKNRLINRAVE